MLIMAGNNGEATALKFIDWQTYSCAPPGEQTVHHTCLSNESAFYCVCTTLTADSRD
jgi:hypothetical protein